MTRARNSANLASHGNLFVDITNDRTGIGSVVPAQNLHVAGTAGFHADVTFTGDNYNATWDRSDNSLKFVDNAVIKLGNNNDLSFSHDGSASRIQDSYGALFIGSNLIELKTANLGEIYLSCNANGAVSLRHNDVTKFATTAYGTNTTGTAVNDGLVVAGVATVTTMNVTGVLTYDDVTSVDSVGIVTARQGVRVPADGSSSSNFISVGASSDLRLFHESGHSKISNFTNNLKITSPSGSSVRITKPDESGNVAVFHIDAETHLYYNGGHKFSTVSDGIRVIGNATIGDSIIHDGDTNTKIRFPTNDQISFETGGSEQMKVAGTNITLGTNSTTGHILQIKNRGNDCNNTVALGLDIQAAWIRIGDALSGGQTYGNGLGIKFHDSGVIHWSVGTIGSSFYLSNTSGSGTQLFPSSRTDALVLTNTGNATFHNNVTVGGNLSVTGTTALSSTVTIPDSIVHDGDTDTKIRFPSADTFSVETGGNERFRIDSGGVVAVNSTNATSTSVFKICKDGGGEAQLRFETASVNTASIVLDNAEQLKFKYGGTEVLRIASDGFVGINEDNPKTGLTIAKLGDYSTDDGNTYYMPVGKWSSAWNKINVIDNSTDYWVGFVGGYTKSSSTVNIALAPNRGNTGQQAGMYISGEATGAASADFTVGKIVGGSTTGQGTSGNVRATKSEVFRIKNNGRVGVGTNNPLSGTHISDGTAYGSPQNSSRKATLTISAGSESSADIQLLSANYNHIFFGDSADPNTGVIYYSHTGGSTDNMVFSTAGGERLRITSTGGLKFTSQTTTIETAGITHHTNNNLYIRGGTGGLVLGNQDNTNTIYISESNFIRFETNNGTERLRINSSGNLKLPDSAKIELGGAQTGSGDLQLYFDSAHSRLVHTPSTGDLVIQSNDIYLTNAAGNKYYFRGIEDDRVDIYHSHQIKLTTTSTGIYVTGNIQVTGAVNPSGNLAFTSNNCQIQTGSSGHMVAIQGGATNMGGRIEFRGGNSSGDIRMYAQGATSTQVERLRIDSSGRVLIGSTAKAGDSALQVYTSDQLHPAIRTNAPNANGYTMFSDAYTAGESQVNMGIAYSSASLVLSVGCKVNTSSDDAYVSSQGTYNTRPTVLRLDTDGSLSFHNTASASTTPTDNAVSLSERLRITSMGDVYAGNEGGYAIFDNSTLRPRFQFRQGTGTNRGFAIIETRGDANGQDIFIAKSREGNGTGLINAGDHLGRINFAGADGNNMINGAQIFAYTQSTKTVATDRMPTNLSFRTHDDNTSGLVERIRIFHDGRVSMSKNGWAGSDSSFGLTVHTGSTSDGGNAVSDGIMIVSQNNNGNQNSTTGKLMFCGHAQTNGPFIYAKNVQAYGKKDLVFHTRSTANDYTTQVAETLRINYQGNVGINEPSPTAQLVVRATTNDNPAINLYRESGNVDMASINWVASVGTNAQINYRGGGGSEGLQFRTSTGSGNAGSMKERFRINTGSTQGVQIYVMNESDNAPLTDKTAIRIQNGIGGGDIGSDSMPTHIDWAWRDANPNDTPQCRISGNVGDGGDPNSLQKEGKGFLTFHCSDTNSSSSNDIDPPQRLRIAHNGTFTGSSSNNISDQRLKENIATITDPIAKIKALKGRTFTWKSEARMREGTHYGFVAQEVESIIPDLIVDDTGIRIFDKDDVLQPSNVITPPVGGGYAKSVDSDGVTPVLVEALKEALAKIEVLEAKVAALEG